MSDTRAPAQASQPVALEEAFRELLTAAPDCVNVAGLDLSALHRPHRLQDVQSLLLHRAAVQQVLQSPAALTRIRETLTRWMQTESRSMPLWQQWERILATQDWTRALADDDAGQQLRQASPMGTALPEADRLAILGWMRLLRERVRTLQPRA